MSKFRSYLVCKDHLEEVRDFLKDFFFEDNGRYNHSGWVTLLVPETSFQVNLMRGHKQPLTQNMTFEIYLDSLENLQRYADKHGCQIESFFATETAQHYRYYYIEIQGPASICKMEISYSEDLE